MDKFNIALLVDVKQEYTIQLIQLLHLQIYSGIKSIYDAAREYCEHSKDSNVLKRFQQLLSGVPKWNTDKIQEEFKRIEKNTECDWLEDLLTAVFVSHTKVLTAIQMKNNNKKTIQLNVPDGPYFVHKCYIEVAREFWKRPFLMSHQLSNIDLQRNLAESEKVIKESIHETVRRMLPVRSILKEYLGSDYKDEEITDEDITSNISLNMKNNLRKLVQREIEQTLSKREETFEGGTDVKDDDSVKQVEIPQKKKKSSENINDYTVNKIDQNDDNKLEKELIEAITTNNNQSEQQSNQDFKEEIEEKVNINNINVNKDEIKGEIKDEIKGEIKEEVKNDNVVASVIVEDENQIIQNIEKLQEDIRSQLDLTQSVDIFTIPKQITTKTTNEIMELKSQDVLTTPKQETLPIPYKKENPIDIFSFFEDAAPYSR
jgi:hypothetical protein